MTERLIQIPPFGVTASLTRNTSCTIHGCRPTSVVVHPASNASTAAGPATTAIRRNRFESIGLRPRRRRHQNHGGSSANAVPIPTMIWNELWTTLAGGRSALGT